MQCKFPNTTIAFNLHNQVSGKTV